MRKNRKQFPIYGSTLLFIILFVCACKKEPTNPVLSEKITITPSITVSAVSTPTPDVAPSVFLTPTLTPVLLPTITEQIEETPTITTTPTLTPTVEPTVTVSPTPLPSPTLYPKQRVYHGWQQVSDPVGKYEIVFSAVYDKTEVQQEQNFFCYYYTSSNYLGTAFMISCYIEEDYEKWQEVLLEKYPEINIEKKNEEYWYSGITKGVYREGVVYPGSYTSIGTNGVVQIERSCVQEKMDEYLKENYNWYIYVQE